ARRAAHRARRRVRRAADAGRAPAGRAHRRAGRAMSGPTAELVRGLPVLLANHLELTVVALVAGIALATPLALAALRWPRLRYPLVTATALVQTIPGLALLALMVPLVASTGGLFVGASAFGFVPAALALTLYAILPVLRNAVTGLLGVDAAAVDAAHG